MVHNGIEYGLMQAYAEGFEIMHASDYELDLGSIAEMWMHGTVVRSWLLELAGARVQEPAARTSSTSRAGSRTRARALDGPGGDRPRRAGAGHHAALLTRFRSRQDDSYGAKVLAALRNEFGGHAVKTD